MPLEKELADASLEDMEPIAATSGEKAGHPEITSIPANYTMIQVRPRFGPSARVKLELTFTQRDRPHPVVL